MGKKYNEHVAINQKRKSLLLNVSMCYRTDIARDYYLMIAKQRIKLQKP